MATKTKIARKVMKQEPANGTNLTDAQRGNVHTFLEALGVPNVKSGFLSGGSPVHRKLDGSHRIEVKQSGDFTYLRGTYSYRQYPGAGGETHTTRMMLYKDRVLCEVESGPGSRGEWTVTTDGKLHVELPEDHKDHAAVWGVGEIDWSRHIDGYAPTLRTFSDSPKDFDTTALWMLRNPVEALPYADAMLAQIDKALGPIPSLESLAMKLVNEIATCKMCKQPTAESHRSDHMLAARRWAKRLKQGRSSRAQIASEKAKIDERRAAQAASKALVQQETQDA